MTERQYVIFTLEQEQYGVDIMHVKEISEFKKCNKIPHTPSFIEGIINYRGAVTPIINLRKKFQLSEGEIDSQTRIIIINLKDKQVGFLVDEASQVLTIDQEMVDPAPKIVTDIQEEFIEGIAKLEDRMVILLDLENVLNEKEKETVMEIQ